MDDHVAVALEEYRALRQEILSSITTQHSILTFGTVAVSVLASAALSQARDKDQAESFLIALLLLGLPTLCFAVVAMWMNEVSRMLRAGWHLRGLETRINRVLAARVLSWESKAHELDQPDIEKNHFRLVVLVFGTLTATFLSLGLYELWQDGTASTGLRVSFTGVCALISGMFVLVGDRIRRDYLRLRAKWTQ